MPARGTAEWRGDVQTGSGTFTAGDSISGGYTFKSRFEDGPGSNPEQLIAAAHASCFSMALSNGLAKTGNPAISLNTSVEVDFQPGVGITEIRITLSGEAENLDAAGFLAAAQDAKANCPVSKALAAVPITLSVV